MEEGEGERHPWEWAASIESKTKDAIRVVAINVGSLSTKPCDQKCPVTRGCHQCRLNTLALKYEVDVSLISETNLNWPVMPENHTLPHRISRWGAYRKSVVSSYKDFYCKATKQAHQWGGTAVIARKDVSPRYKCMGTDKSGLGRWSYMTFQGSGGRYLTVISGYRPVYNPNYEGSVWCQQQSGLDKMGVDKDPRTAFEEDLVQEVKGFYEQGHTVILGMDYNGDVTRPSTLLTGLRRLGMKNPFLEKYNQMQPTRSGGITPIDVIMVSSVLIPFTRCGYTPPVSDHYGLFVDISEVALFGQAMPALLPPQARRLNSNDERAVEKYLSILIPFVLKHNLVARAEALADSFHTPLTSEEKDEYEKIDKLWIQGQLLAEVQCRHLHMGAIEWTPLFALVQLERKFLKLLKRDKQAQLERARGQPTRSVHARYLRRLAKQVGHTEKLSWSFEEV